MLCIGISASEEYMAEYKVQNADHGRDPLREVVQAELNPTLTVSHAKELELGVTAKYPIRHVDVKSFSIPQGNLRQGECVHGVDHQTYRLRFGG